MYAIMDRTTRKVEGLEKLQKEQSSRHLPSDTKNDDIRESENMPSSLEDEFSNLALDEDKKIMECHKMPLVLEGELQNLTFFEKKELAINKEPSLKEKQVQNQHPKLIMKNVLVGVEDFYFPIESLTFGMKENQQVSFIERPSIAKVWIEVEHGEMTLLVGEEKMKFDL